LERYNVFLGSSVSEVQIIIKRKFFCEGKKNFFLQKKQMLQQEMEFCQLMALVMEKKLKRKFEKRKKEEKEKIQILGEFLMKR